MIKRQISFNPAIVTPKQTATIVKCVFWSFNLFLEIAIITAKNKRTRPFAKVYSTAPVIQYIPSPVDGNKLRYKAYKIVLKSKMSFDGNAFVNICFKKA